LVVFAGALNDGASTAAALGEVGMVPPVKTRKGRVRENAVAEGC